MSKFLTFNFMESPKVFSAYRFAAQAHKGQVRKYSGEPYIVHPLEVAKILCGIGCDDEDMICAALLHDVVEDCDVSLEQIQANFGERVAQLVEELTEVPTEGNRAKRKYAECNRIKGISQDAKTIKCCDLISNTRDIAENDPNFAEVYLREKRDLLCVALTDADPVAYQYAMTTWRKSNELLGHSNKPN